MKPSRTSTERLRADGGRECLFFVSAFQLYPFGLAFGLAFFGNDGRAGGTGGLFSLSLLPAGTPHWFIFSDIWLPASGDPPLIRRQGWGWLFPGPN